MAINGTYILIGEQVFVEAGHENGAGIIAGPSTSTGGRRHVHSRACPAGCGGTESSENNRILGYRWLAEQLPHRSPAWWRYAVLGNFEQIAPRTSDLQLLTLLHTQLVRGLSLAKDSRASMQRINALLSELIKEATNLAGWI